MPDRKEMWEICRFAYDNEVSDGTNRLDFVVPKNKGLGYRSLRQRVIKQWMGDSILIDDGKAGRVITKDSILISVDNSDPVYQDYICMKYFDKTFQEMQHFLERIWKWGFFNDDLKILSTSKLNSAKEHRAYMVEHQGIKIKMCKSYDTCIGFCFVGPDNNMDYNFCRRYSNTSSKHWCNFLRINL